MLDSCTGRRVRYCASIATRGTSSCSSADAISVNRCVVFRAGCRSSGRCPIASPLTPSGSSEILTLLFRLHRQRWGNAATPFLLAEPFHRDFATQAFHQGWLRLWFLEIDGKPVAALHGFRFAGADSAYQAGRDPAFRQQPVGFVLLAHAVREALTDGMGEYRLLRGGAAYKERFATGDPGLETFGLPRGASAQLLLTAAHAAKGRSLGVRRILDRP